MIDYIATAKNVLEIESQALKGLIDKIDSDFSLAIDAVLKSQGKAIICGMGKSGIIGKKIAATFASTGTPSFFMHPGEAYHGDLGMVSPDDIFIALSNSGETDEVVKLIPFLKDNGNILISMTGNPSSSLAQASDFHLNVSVEKEACPLQLAPTASTTAALAMGDALAVTLMKARDFQPENFARFHPGGSLGRRLLSRVENEMIVDNIPFLDAATSAKDVISTISKSGLGLAIVMQATEPLVITDGDLRRAIEKHQGDFFDLVAADMMVANPVSVVVGTRVEDALQLMEARSVNSILVIENAVVVGVFKK
jgi:arabinose-5-phosphate isomerase